LPGRAERLPVAVELGLESDLRVRPALAITDPRLVDPHGHPAVPGELGQDAAVGAGIAQRLVHGGRAQSGNEEEHGMSAGGVGLRDDRPQAGSAADHLVVEHVEVLAAIAGTLVDDQRQCHPPAVAHEAELACLAADQRGRTFQELRHAADSLSLEHEQDVPWLDARGLGAAARHEELHQHPFVCLQLQRGPDVVGDGADPNAQLPSARQRIRRSLDGHDGHERHEQQETRERES